MKTVIKKYLRAVCLLLLISHLFVRWGYSQTTNISGVINSYTKVVSIPCSSTVTVQGTAGFAVGDTVLIIQMKGATINSTNGTTYGSVTAYNNAGNYELARIASMSGNTISFVNTLIRGNTTAGLVQLVKVRNYVNAT